MNRSAGYTLIEVLIMLAVTAILAATVLETVRASTANGIRIEQAARNASQDYITLASVRRAVQASRPDYIDGAHRFVGDEMQFSALTSAPVASYRAGVEPFNIQFVEEDSGVSLVYEDAAGSLRVGHWRGATGRFRYLGEDPEDGFDFVRSTTGQSRQHTWSEAWPRRVLGRTSPQEPNYYSPLPLAIRAEILTDGSVEAVMVFQLPLNAPPAPRMSDILGQLTP